jgi:1-deoxy-D-xylulose-5-phosphate reductoisomerase
MKDEAAGRKRLSLLGATGSIGRSTLEVLREHPDRFELMAVAAGNSWQQLAEIVNEFRPPVAAIANEEHAGLLREAIRAPDCRVLAGPEGIVEAAAGSGAQTLVSAAVGAAGLEPTLAAIESGLDIALANKETLVMAGELVTATAQRSGAQLMPVDSEHSALFQCLECGAPEEVDRLVLTASGGPFRGRRAEDLRGITAEEALAHPTWRMGPKITVDSATLANKALEVIEAHWLFGVPYDRIDVIVHPQSAVHSLVHFVDGTTMAQVGPPDMKGPILYALTYPERVANRAAPLDLCRMGTLTFEDPDWETFPCLALGYEAGRQGGLAPAVYSAANEAAVELFLEGRLAFERIAPCIESALASHPVGAADRLRAIRDAETWARNHVLTNTVATCKSRG